jgi:hypothetical protein
LRQQRCLITHPHLEQRWIIYFSLKETQFFLFALRPENGYAGGEFVAAGDLLSPQLICDDGLAIADYCTGLGTEML